MSKRKTFCDGRRRGERAPRKVGHCTACSSPLPKVKRKWGLVWDTGIHGICIACVTRLREGISHKYLNGDMDEDS